MKVCICNPNITRNRSIQFRSNIPKTKRIEKNTTDNNLATTITVASLIAAGVAIFGISVLNKKPKRIDFEALLKEKGFAFKNGVLFDSNNKKFSGELKRSTGRKGVTNFEMIETQLFKEGMLTEKTFKDCFGNELKGEFYDNGKLTAKVEVFSRLKDRGYCFTKYTNGHEESGHGLLKRKESVFEQFRKKN